MHKVLERIWDKKLIILLVITVVLFLFLYGNLGSFLPHDVDVELMDHCGLMPTGVAEEHTIREALDCEAQCFNRCETDDMKLRTYNFIERGRGACHLCICTCK